MADDPLSVGAVVLAAGLAKRMGRSKLDLPWPRGGSVLGRVLDVLLEGGVDHCVVVTGGHRQRVERIAEGRGVSAAFNPAYEEEDMQTSVRVGLAALKKIPVAAGLIMPADHPLVRPETVSGLITEWRKEADHIWIPSHKRRRGHPILIPRTFWAAVISEESRYGLRSFLDRQEGRIVHLNVDDPGIRMDIDDPKSYDELRENIGS